MRLRPEVSHLRSRQPFAAARSALEGARTRFGCRIVHFALLSNHLHLIVEAPDERALARAMKGLAVRLARALNRVHSRKGQVFAERYHTHYLRAPREVAHAVGYVENNFRVHLARRGRELPAGFRDPCSSAALPDLVAQPRTWLLTIGWRTTRWRSGPAPQDPE